MKVLGETERFDSTASMARELRGVLDKPGWDRLKIAFGSGEAETREYTRVEAQALYDSLVAQLVREAASKPKIEVPSAARKAELKAMGWRFHDKKDTGEPI